MLKAVASEILGFDPSIKMSNFYWGTPSNTTITLIAYSVYAFTIIELYQLQTASGSITVTIQVNGIPVTGLNSLSASAVAQNIPATAANTVNIGDQITVVLSANSSATGLIFTLKATETSS